MFIGCLPKARQSLLWKLASPQSYEVNPASGPVFPMRLKPKVVNVSCLNVSSWAKTQTLTSSFGGCSLVSLPHPHSICCSGTILNSTSTIKFKTLLSPPGPTTWDSLFALGNSALIQENFAGNPWGCALNRKLKIEQ